MARYYVAYVANGDMNGFVDEVPFVNEAVIDGWRARVADAYGVETAGIIGFTEIEPERRNTGIVRRIDELGRVCIPSEIRKKIGLSPDGGEPMEIMLTSDGGVLIKPYAPEGKRKGSE